MAKIALVIVHPRSAVPGNKRKLRDQSELIDGWKGPVFVLDDDAVEDAENSTAANYIEMIDVLIDERESKGKICRIPTLNDPDDLEDAVATMVRAFPEGDFLLTGISLDGSFDTLIDFLNEQEREVNSDDSALDEDDLP